MKKKSPVINLLFILICCLANVAKATNLTEVITVSNKILLLKFVDGQITYHALGQPASDDAVTLFPGGRFNVSTAGTASIYDISSINDANYAVVIHPDSAGINMRSEQTWASDDMNRPTHVQTVYVYLFLKKAIASGKIYTITVNNPVINNAAKTIQFTYNEFSTRSEAIHVNNLGYSEAAAKKYSYIFLWMGNKSGLNLTDTTQVSQAASLQRQAKLVRIADQQIVYTGTVSFRKAKTEAEFYQYGTPNNNFQGADVYEFDFSSYNTPGTYVVSVEGMGCSYPFDIGKETLKDPFYYTMKALYENRSGIALNTPYAQYNRPAPHNPLTTPGFKLYYSSVRHYDLNNNSGDANVADTPVINSNVKGLVNTWGWYQDAGDWDSYSSHQKVPAYLLFLFETNPVKFGSFQLDIENESNNSLPDLLDEARWLLRFYKRSKDSIKNTTLGGTGGVPGGRVFGDNYPNSDNSNPEDGKGSWQDTKRKWVMLGQDPWMTYFYAALAAHFAYILQRYNYTDPEGIDWQQEAIDGWNWAKNNSSAADENTIRYGYNLSLCRMYASASLYRLTGDKTNYESSFIYDMDNAHAYFDYAINDYHIGFTDNYQFLCNDDYSIFPMIMYGLAANNQPLINQPILGRVLGMVRESTDFIVGDNGTNLRACRWGGTPWQNLGIGQGTTPYIQLAPLAHMLFKQSDPSRAANWLQNMFTTADYFLGSNSLNMTYISGLGEKNPEQFFHIDAFFCSNSFTGPIRKKGIIPYGAMADCFADLGSCFGYPGPYQYYYGLRNGKAYPMGNDDVSNGSSLPARPAHERYMPSRTSPLANEFTVHQTGIAGPVVYGFLWAASSGNVVLPVNFLRFSGVKTGNNVLLEWKTANEINAASYEVQRSRDDINFFAIANATAEGNSINIYNSTDMNPYKGINYYRIKQMDKNGLYYFSNIIRVNAGEPGNSTGLFPNPSKDWIQIDQRFLQHKYSIIDATGKQVKSSIVNGKIAISDLPSGTYCLLLFDVENNLPVKSVFIKY
jgi:endoglucanase